MTSWASIMEHMIFGLAMCKSRKITRKNCLKNARIPTLGYGAVQERMKVKKPLSLAQVSEHFLDNFWNQEKIHECLLQREVNWHFNPPAASHWGGVWERFICTIRRVMTMVLKEQILDDEGLQTVICEIESIVNGRPLSKVSDDSRDINALSPNHLLMLKSNESYPPGVLSKEDSYCRKRWIQVQFLVDLFWKRCFKEYLPSLQQRQK